MKELSIKDIQKIMDTGFEKQAIMIKKGFDGMDARFEAVDKRFDAIDNRFEKLETKVDVIQGKLDNILYKEIDRVETRVTKIEKHLGFKTA